MANRSFQFDLILAAALLALALVEEFLLPVPAGAVRRHGDLLGALSAVAVIAPLLWRRAAARWSPPPPTSLRS